MTNTAPDKLAAKFTNLANWYKANKPAVTTIRINRDDATALRAAWIANQIECRKNGFQCTVNTPTNVVSMAFRGFELVEVA